jgi:hypothetical protein
MARAFMKAPMSASTTTTPSIKLLAVTALRPFSRRPECDPAPRGEFAQHPDVKRIEELHQVVANPVDTRLVKLALVAERPEVEFQRLGFNAPFVGRVLDLDGCEIGLAGERAEGGELGEKRYLFRERLFIRSLFWREENW